MINIKKNDNNIFKNVIDKVKRRYFLNNHMKVFRELEKHMNLAKNDNETVELHFSKIIIEYNFFYMLEDTNGGDELNFSTPHIEEECIILLKHNTTYKVIKKTDRGCYLELIEK